MKNEKPKPKTLMEVFAPTLSDRAEALESIPLTWAEVDRERLMVIDHLITKSIAMFPSSAPLQDMRYLMESLKTAQMEINRLHHLCHDQGIITSLPRTNT